MRKLRRHNLGPLFQIKKGPFGPFFCGVNGAGFRAMGRLRKLRPDQLGNAAFAITTGAHQSSERKDSAPKVAEDMRPAALLISTLVVPG